MLLGAEPTTAASYVLATHRFPLGPAPPKLLNLLERAMGFEPTTPTLARLCSTSGLPGPAFGLPFLVDGRHRLFCLRP